MPFYSPSTRGFYDAELHGASMPADAIKITKRQHQEFMLAQRQGHEIVATKTGPRIVHIHTDEGTVLTHAIKRLKAEARRRILAIASLERQSNDNAALALAALGQGDSTVSASALERRHKIDAVREASNRFEAVLAHYTVDELTAFDASTAPWPE